MKIIIEPGDNCGLMPSTYDIDVEEVLISTETRTIKLSPRIDILTDPPRLHVNIAGYLILDNDPLRGGPDLSDPDGDFGFR